MSAYSAVLVQIYCALHCLDWLLIFSFVFPVKAFSKLRWNEELRYNSVIIVLYFISVLKVNSVLSDSSEWLHCFFLPMFLKRNMHRMIMQLYMSFPHLFQAIIKECKILLLSINDDYIFFLKFLYRIKIPMISKS